MRPLLRLHALFAAHLRVSTAVLRTPLSTSPSTHPRLPPLPRVCAQLGVCVTVLKQQCREHGVARWPFRKIRKLDHMLCALEGAVNRGPPGAASSSGKPALTAQQAHTDHQRKRKIGAVKETLSGLLTDPNSAAHMRLGKIKYKRFRPFLAEDDRNLRPRPLHASARQVPAPADVPVDADIDVVVNVDVEDNKSNAEDRNPDADIDRSRAGVDPGVDALLRPDFDMNELPCNEDDASTSFGAPTRCADGVARAEGIGCADGMVCADHNGCADDVARADSITRLDGVALDSHAARSRAARSRAAQSHARAPLPLAEHPPLL
ncbi:unnamed protein product [Closterium sp. Yama58-4]|nr:unnamed protein product [Closterium sp. Yama58-4]